ncbi:MAG: acyl-CoA dehydrogenase family protein [Bacillota bacterium]|uniref:Butyryl-CoA dehydrogenase n=1 Tax=[Clostridium] aminophilum TaxID=1526 RepID=A0A1I6J3I3_9FIRM|nr:acyl-CoA dehydrogenase family protein [[Clostridium] aminophilum]MDT3845156.1 acyl-CoA dehydrogenase family protein [Bacillota bacterium]SFR73516.1 butyryl-CoA dehydrogenase [[Clostridium] aminophilum]
MNFELTEQQLAIQETARKFAQEELLPGVIERDEAGEFPMEAFHKAGKLGLIGLPYPKEYGGQGLGYMEYALAVEEVSKVDASFGISYSVTTSLYGGSVWNSDATDEQKKKFLPEVLKGECLGSFGLTEPNAGSDAGGCITTAVKDGDDYIINGLKCFNTNGPLARYTAVYALTEPEKKSKGLACFIVDRNTPGVRTGKIENKMGIRCAQVSEVIFENCRVPASCKVAMDGNGFKTAMKTLDCGRIGVAAQGLGIAEGAFEIAKNYMKERQQFNTPIAKFQYPQFKMAELSMKIEAAKYMLYKAATDHDTGKSYNQSAAKAKFMCTNVAMEVTEWAVQFMGGNGYMKEYHVERMMRDAKITQIYEGTNEIQQLIVGGALFR